MDMKSLWDTDVFKIFPKIFNFIFKLMFELELDSLNCLSKLKLWKQIRLYL